MGHTKLLGLLPRIQAPAAHARTLLRAPRRLVILITRLPVRHMPRILNTMLPLQLWHRYLLQPQAPQAMATLARLACQTMFMNHPDIEYMMTFLRV